VENVAAVAHHSQDVFFGVFEKGLAVVAHRLLEVSWLVTPVLGVLVGWADRLLRGVDKLLSVFEFFFLNFEDGLELVVFSLSDLPLFLFLNFSSLNHVLLLPLELEVLLLDPVPSHFRHVEHLLESTIVY
jgi:hypothetical protein